MTGSNAEGEITVPWASNLPPFSTHARQKGGKNNRLYCPCPAFPSCLCCSALPTDIIIAAHEDMNEEGMEGCRENHGRTEAWKCRRKWRSVEAGVRTIEKTIRLKGWGANQVSKERRNCDTWLEPEEWDEERQQQAAERKGPIKARPETEDKIWRRNADSLTRRLQYRDRGRGKSMKDEKDLDCIQVTWKTHSDFMLIPHT